MISIQITQNYNEHLEFTDEELHYFIIHFIDLIKARYDNIKDVVICMHPIVFKCLISSKYGFKISCMKSNTGYGYKWCDTFPILITHDCIIRVMIDP